jgi:hypothetical protein
MGQFIMFCLIISKLIGRKDQNNKVLQTAYHLQLTRMSHSTLTVSFLLYIICFNCKMIVLFRILEY